MSEQPHLPSDDVRYTERLFTPWWWYIAAIGVAALLGAEFALAMPGNWAWIPAGVLVVLCVFVVYRMSSGRITTTSKDITAGDQTVALATLEAAIRLSPTELRRLVGRHGDPIAFNFIRSWVGPGVQLIISDPDNMVPYWVVSTRHPDRLLNALAAESVPVR